MEGKIEEYYDEGADVRPLPSRQEGIVKEEDIDNLRLMNLLDSYNDNGFDDVIETEKLPFELQFIENDAYTTYHNLYKWYMSDEIFRGLGDQAIDLLILGNMEQYYGKTFDDEDIKKIE